MSQNAKNEGYGTTGNVTYLLALSALGRVESVCRFVCSAVGTPIAVPPRAIWLAGDTKEDSVKHT